MTQAVYVRLYPKDLDFIRGFSKQKQLDQSKVIKSLIHRAVKQEKLNLAIEKYTEGLKTIRESAEIADLEYREFVKNHRS